MLRSRAQWLFVTFAALAILFVLARPFLLGLSFVARAANRKPRVSRKPGETLKPLEETTAGMNPPADEAKH